MNILVALDCYCSCTNVRLFFLPLQECVSVHIQRTEAQTHVPVGFSTEILR